MDEKSKISRRNFIKIAGGSIGATVLACSGLTFFTTRRPVVEFSETSCVNQTEKGDEVLIVYASKCGSTGEVAEFIGKELCDSGIMVDVRLINDTIDPSQYQAVIIGSAIRMGKWLPDASKFIETHQETLSHVPTAYFTVCMTLIEDTIENRNAVADYMKPVNQVLEPIDTGLLAGKMDYDKLSCLERTIIKAIGTPEGDYRNWETIHTWTNDLRRKLLGG